MRDRIIGITILIGGVILLVGYTYLAILVPAGWDPLGIIGDFRGYLYWIIIIPLWIMVSGYLVLSIWLGWSTFRTPPPEILEKEIKEIEELEKTHGQT